MQDANNLPFSSAGGKWEDKLCQQSSSRLLCCYDGLYPRTQIPLGTTTIPVEYELFCWNVRILALF